MQETALPGPRAESGAMDGKLMEGRRNPALLATSLGWIKLVKADPLGKLLVMKNFVCELDHGNGRAH